MISVISIILSISFNGTVRIWRQTGGVVRLKKSDFDTFIIEIPKFLGKANRGVVGRSVRIPSRQFLFITSPFPLPSALIP